MRRGIRSETLGSALAFVAFALTAFGVLMVYSASTSWGADKFGDPAALLKRQAVGAVLALLAFGFCAAFPYRLWQRHSRVLVGLSAVLLILVLVVGSRYNGARRWLRFAGFGCQPSEIAKLAVIVHAAAFLAVRRDRIRDFKQGFLPALAPIGLLCALTIVEPDFGTALFLAGLGVLVLLVGGLRVRHLALVGAAALPVVTVLMATRFEHVAQRLSFFTADKLGYQVQQGLIALGSGGFFGQGIGAGTGKLFFLPEAAGDFIAPAIGQETGFVGILLMILLFMAFAGLGFLLARRVLPADRFAFFLVTGITAWITLQAVVNLAVVSASAPTKGIALPFISYGSTSLVVGFAAVGMLVNVSRTCRPEDAS